ncbi:hypothetical protein FBZ98_101977 [Rhizobium sp. ERR 922]|uniref:hypothetical protein n=1 Tax=unclassified Rhizobium TaxID=2613769 RepID=UPI00119F2ADB|nr:MULTISPECIES: hypothetical protein [unclassified Rhizobium]TWB61632.1 hypothetical protein FBZ98_101977 [Rhizobium sp. ERR 922]TWC04558.1 hypothetical protein FBZ97_101977 [Rhizobium sp. ERR 942]
MVKLTKAMRACLVYYRDNEFNPDRHAYPPYDFNIRQVNRALDLDYLKVGPGGWHILSDAGRAALNEEGGK